jgi:hypothetical protein
MATRKGVSIDSVIVSGSPANTMSLTLTEDEDVGFTIDETEASFRGVQPDSYSANTLVFSNGIPVSISEDGSKPVLVFSGKYADGTLAEFYAD